MKSTPERRGRKPLSPGKKHGSRLVVKLTDAQLAQITLKAQSLDKGASTWVREIALAASHQ